MNEPLALRIAGLLPALALAGCATLNPPERATATLRTDAPVVDEGIARGGTWPGATWWKSYEDPLLDSLVETALAGAPDLAAADARIRRARQEVGATRATQGLTATAEGTWNYQRLSDNGLLPPQFLGFHWYDQSDLGASIRYQFDWWGRQRATLEAALDRAHAQAAEREAAATLLAASVAASYFGWQADTARIQLQQQLVELQQEAVSLAQRRVAAELEAADHEIEQRARLADAQEGLAQLQGSRRQHVVTLAALLGVDAAALPALQARPLPPATAGLPDDVGTNLLARRPDILASRWRVEAALRDTDVQRANFYPDISINVLAGLSSIELGRLLRSDSAVPRIGLAFDLPLFERGLVRARHAISIAELDLAIAEYEQRIVQAAQQAGAAAVSLEQSRQQRLHRASRLQAADDLAAQANARLQRGLIARGAQIAAESERILQRERMVEVDLAALLADVQLRQALGGDAAPENPAP